MADKAIFDPISKLIILKPGVVDVDVAIDLYSDAKEEWLGDLGLNKYKFPFRVVGGAVTEGDQTIAGYFYLQYGWRVRPQEASHLLIVDGILLVDGGGDPFVNTLGNYNVRVKYVLPLQAVKITAGSGVTEQDKIDIVDLVWDEVLAGHSPDGAAGKVLLASENDPEETAGLISKRLASEHGGDNWEGSGADEIAKAVEEELAEKHGQESWVGKPAYRVEKG